MQKSFLFFLMVIGLFWGCQRVNRSVAPDLSVGSSSLRVVQRSTEVVVKVPQKVYEQQGDAVLWSLALKKGMTKLNRMILNQHLAVRITDVGLAPERNFIQKKGKLLPAYNSYAQEYVQAFKVQVKLIPDISMAGKVIDLKKESYILGEYGFCFLGFFKQFFPLKENTFFFVGKLDNSNNLIRITGMGKIVQSFEPEEQANSKYEVLANAQLYELSDEVEKGDFVFLPKIIVSAVDNPNYIQQEGIKSEVVVEPKKLKKPSLPKESK